MARRKVMGGLQVNGVIGQHPTPPAPDPLFPPPTFGCQRSDLSCEVPHGWAIMPLGVSPPGRDVLPEHP